MPDTWGDSLPTIGSPPPGPKSREYAARLRKVESRNVTYVSESFPVFWEEAHGSNVRDVDGNVYVDLSGAFGVAALGHSPGSVVRALAAQAERLIHGMGDIHPPAMKLHLLEKLTRLAPWRSARAVLASSGSEAVEIALKTALMATRRSGVLAFEGSYHGLTLGALSVTHRDHFRAPFESRLFEGVQWAPFPGGPDGTPVHEALARVRSILSDRDGSAVGAVILEPIQGRAGVRIPPPGFLGQVAALAHEHRALVICDEIFMGFGRTGRVFAYEHEGITPDLICVGKALGGGMPLSACLGPRRIMDAWPESSGESMQTSTFLGHPLSCAAGIAFLEALDREGLVSRAARVGKVMLGKLTRTLEGVPLVRDVRGRGLVLGIELRSDESDPTGPEIAEQLLRRGMILLPAGPDGEVLELAPALTVSEKLIDWSVETLRDVLTDPA